jgi:molybdopterin converting factor small subunit
VIYQSEEVGVNFFLVAIVNFYAAARQAAGSQSQQLPSKDLGSLLEQLTAINGELAKLIPTCSFLVNGTACEDKSQLLKDGDVVDVLPQFAGG